MDTRFYLSLFMLLFLGIGYFTDPFPNKPSTTHKRSPAAIPEDGDQFIEVAKVGSTPNCAQNYSKVLDCYNDLNPPLPSIIRSLETTNSDMVTNNNTKLFKRPIDDVINHFPFGKNTPGLTQILPSSRTSNDGRVVLAGNIYGGLGLQIFRPENIDYDLKTKNGHMPLSSQLGLHPLIYSNPKNSKLIYDTYGDWQGPTQYHYNLCDDSGTANRPVPRKCQAKRNATDPYLDGDCYDITIQAGLQHTLELNGIQQASHWEFRSSPVTLFVYRGKEPSAQTMWIYPRKGTFQLPPYSIYDNFPGQSAVYKTTAEMCYPVTQTNLPAWCEFLYNQSYSATNWMDKNGNNIQDSGELWDGTACGGPNSGTNCGDYTFFEQSTTKDGKLFVINGGPGIWYSYNESPDTCQAGKFNHYKPLSFMPFDPNIYNNYDIAKSLRRGNTSQPFRDSRGVNITPGDRIYGAYTWIDREGKNLFFSAMNEARDGYFAESAFPEHHPDYPTHDLNPDTDAGKAHTVMGTWTNGKMIIMDNSFNVSDFGGKAGWVEVDHPTTGDPLGKVPLIFQYNLNLYRESPPITVKPRATTSPQSFENLFNEYDALSPLLPFDVVWTMGSNVQRNPEVNFDEYLMPSAFIVAHMNSPLIRMNNDFFPYDGFVPLRSEGVRFGGVADFTFSQSPRLQNAVTFNSFFKGSLYRPPSELTVLGGARVEPVSLGGVQGKGLYLDGMNDYINSSFFNPSSNDWFYSVWLDSREDDENKTRNVFYFPDGSWIGMSRKFIVAYNPWDDEGRLLRAINISSLGLTRGKYYHFGVKAFTKDGLRKLAFYINGSPIKFPVMFQAGTSNLMEFSPMFNMGNVLGFNLKRPLTFLSTKSYFVLGDPGPSFNQGNLAITREPFKGWVDELRVYSLNQSEIDDKNYFEEFICNLSLGSLVNIYKKDGNPISKPLIDKAINHNLFRSMISIPPASVNPTSINPGSNNPPNVIGGINRDVLLNLGVKSKINIGPTNPPTIRGNPTPTTPVIRQLSRTPSSMGETIGSSNFAVVCEQLNIQSHNTPNDLPNQNGQKLCADKVHRNTSTTSISSCYRKKQFKIHHLPLKAGLPRPDFSNVPFCLSCHHNHATIPGLAISALTTENQLRENDPRRQPLDWKRSHTGCVPASSPFPTYPNTNARCASGSYMLDPIFDFHHKIKP